MKHKKSRKILKEYIFSLSYTTNMPDFFPAVHLSLLVQGLKNEVTGLSYPAAYATLQRKKI